MVSTFGWFLQSISDHGIGFKAGLPQYFDEICENPSNPEQDKHLGVKGQSFII